MVENSRVTQRTLCGHLSTLRILPRKFNSTCGIVSREVVGQDYSQQLKSNGVVFATGVSATESLIYQTNRREKETRRCMDYSRYASTCSSTRHRFQTYSLHFSLASIYDM